MDKMLLCMDSELKKVLMDYYNFLTLNKTSDPKSIDYIFSIIDHFDINDKFLKTICFDSNISANGVYIPGDKKIILNTAKLEAACKLHFISHEQMIVDYLSLLLHEINHVLQFRYRYETTDEISRILDLSEFLKDCSHDNLKEYHNLFPDEIDSNIRSAKIIYELSGDTISEINLVNYLMLSVMYRNIIIKSQIHFLYYFILNTDFNEIFENINGIFYGLPKNNEVMESIISSYQTQCLCIDIDNERRLKKCK